MEEGEQYGQLVLLLPTQGDSSPLQTGGGVEHGLVK